MAFVITSPCKDEQAGECVETCPVDCIVEGEGMFYIDPDICIDCGACEAVCPVEAIILKMKYLRMNNLTFNLTAISLNKSKSNKALKTLISMK